MFSTHLSLHACVLRHQRQGLQSFQSLAQHLALLRQRNLLLYGGTDAEKLALAHQTLCKAVMLMPPTGCALPHHAHRSPE